MRRFQTLRPLVLALAMGVIFGFGLLGYNHGNDRDKSPCAGPIPCLTEDWGGKYYIFEGNVNEVVALYSDGNSAEVVSVYLDPDRNIYITILGGQAVDCHNSNIDYGAEDDNGNWVFEPEEHFKPIR